jgi:predicted outer membrane repeat protein
MTLVKGVAAGGLMAIGDFSNNSSTPPEFGGVIYNKGGYLTIGGAGATGDISLHDSRATEAGGVIDNAGGNVSIGTLAPKHAIVLQNNFSPTGGAIYSRGGTLTIESTSFAGNKADDNAAGGGLFVSNTGLTIRRSTFTGNEAGQPGTGDTGEGGAVLLASKLPAAISSSTFAQNNSGAGGAIFYQGNTNANPLKITNCTFYDAPSLDTRDDLYVSSGTAQVTFSTSVNGGFQTINSGKINLRNTIAAAESICQGNPASYIDNGHNIQFSTAPNCPATIPNVDPSLDPDGLQSNGGPTQTVAIEAGSPALNAIGVRNCTTPDGVRVLSDQRLFPRPAKGLNRCDIGAYEGVHNPAP